MTLHSSTYSDLVPSKTSRIKTFKWEVKTSKTASLKGYVLTWTNLVNTYNSRMHMPIVNIEFHSLFKSTNVLNSTPLKLQFRTYLAPAKHLNICQSGVKNVWTMLTLINCYRQYILLLITSMKVLSLELKITLEKGQLPSKTFSILNSN